MSENEYLLKICIIGSNSDLVYKFGNLTADTTWEVNYMSTLGVDMPTKKIKMEDNSIKVVIMNIAGDDYSDAIGTDEQRENWIKQRDSWDSGASGCCIIFDKGKRESFLKVDDWYKGYSGKNKSPVVIVGLITDTEEVSTEEGQQLSEKLDTMYYETALKDKTTIEGIFHYFVQKFLDSKKSSEE
jgi:hypothetical protein